MLGGGSLREKEGGRGSVSTSLYISFYNKTLIFRGVSRADAPVSTSVCTSARRGADGPGPWPSRGDRRRVRPAVASRLVEKGSARRFPAHARLFAQGGSSLASRAREFAFYARAKWTPACASMPSP